MYVPEVLFAIVHSSLSWLPREFFAPSSAIFYPLVGLLSLVCGFFTTLCGYLVVCFSAINLSLQQYCLTNLILGAKKYNVNWQLVKAL